MGMILRIASSRIVGQGDIVGRSGYFSLNLSANSVMRGRLDARRTLKSLVADLRLDKICKAIGISASYFFDDTHGNHVSDISATTLFGNANVNITQGEVKMLKELLAEKERTIKILMAERNIDRAENESKI